MSKKNAQFDKEFKTNAVNCLKEHPDLSISECAKNLGIGLSTLFRWKSQYDRICCFYVMHCLRLRNAEISRCIPFRLAFFY